MAAKEVGLFWRSVPPGCWGWGVEGRSWHRVRGQTWGLRRDGDKLRKGAAWRRLALERQRLWSVQGDRPVSKGNGRLRKSF